MQFVRVLRAPNTGSCIQELGLSALMHPASRAFLQSGNTALAQYSAQVVAAVQVGVASHLVTELTIAATSSVEYFVQVVALQPGQNCPFVLKLFETRPTFNDKGPSLVPSLH